MARPITLSSTTWEQPAAGSSQLPTPGDLYAQTQQQIRGYGNAQQAALRQSYQNALGMAQQSLASTGLAGTSIAPSMRMGYMKQYQLALNNLNQQLTQTKLGAQSTFGLGGMQAQLGQSQLGLQSMLGMGNLGINRQRLQMDQQRFNQQQQAYQNPGYGFTEVPNPQQGYNPGSQGSPYLANFFNRTMGRG